MRGKSLTYSPTNGSNSSPRFSVAKSAYLLGAAALFIGAIRSNTLLLFNRFETIAV
jgi:hypothetical protein